MDPVTPKAEKQGVQLFIEGSAQIKPFVSEIQASAVGINFGIGHFYCAGEDPSAAFEDLVPWVGHIRIEDIAHIREHNHLIAGLGAIDACFVDDALAAPSRIGLTAIALMSVSGRSGLQKIESKPDAVA